MQQIVRKGAGKWVLQGFFCEALPFPGKIIPFPLKENNDVLY